MPGCLPPTQPAPHAARYHRPGDPWPLYASLDRQTMWDEWAHATDGRVPPEEDPRWVCALDVDLRVLDLRDPATRRALRAGIGALRGAWSPDRSNPTTLRVARAARELGVDGMIVPSAARDDGWNLVVLPGAFESVVLRRRRRETAPASVLSG
ncbi:MAG TPA: RES family NAD+ phosphorylase [Candidatus Limnocylindrales bacterium]|nr:RES family NAD+ phosphorylase [Candidatus Limnocylindrales bacterium]